MSASVSGRAQIQHASARLLEPARMPALFVQEGTVRESAASENVCGHTLHARTVCAQASAAAFAHGALLMLKQLAVRARYTLRVA